METFLCRSYHDRERVIGRLRALPLEPALRVTIEPVSPHTDEQRQRVFAMCEELAQRATFPGGGRAGKDDWYRFLLGLMRGEGMVREGNVVVIVGGGLSGATRREASDLIDFIEAYMAERS